MDFCSKMASQTLLEKMKKDSNKNIVVSPLSFNAILNMIAAGSSDSTLKQLLEFLGSTNIEDLNSQFEEFMAIATTEKEGGPVLAFTNGVWISNLLKLADSYEKIVKTVYKSEARSVDFSKAEEVVKEANAWAKSATKGLINDVLKPSDITKETQLILGNALYFEGKWQEQFYPRNTRDQEFYLLEGTIKAPFMGNCTYYNYGSFTGFQVVQIPYHMGWDTKRRFSMYIFLPNEINGLQSLMEKVNSDPEFFAKHSKLQCRKISFWIPKFKFTYFNELLETNPGLTNLDVTEMVSPPTSLRVSKIIQKTFVDINEMGTKAGAVTFACMMPGCAMSLDRQKPITFVADHPFMFTIMEENSGLVFFTGVVLNPLLQSE